MAAGFPRLILNGGGNIFKRENIPIEISMDSLILSQGFKENMQVRAEITNEAKRALDLARQLIEPAFVLERMPVKKICQGKVEVSNTELKIGELSYLLDQASEAIIYLTTIGRKLEKAVNDLSREGSFELAYWLDCAGILALNAVDKEVWAFVENLAYQAGCGVGLSLSPGSLKGWDIKEQYLLCSMLDITKISVTINNVSLLVPHKSASSLIGIGPGYTSKKVLPSCDYCVSDGKCWMRQARREI